MFELQSEMSLHRPLKGDLQIVEPSTLMSHTLPSKQVLSVRHCSFKAVGYDMASIQLTCGKYVKVQVKLTSSRNYGTDLAAICTS